ncbi:MAG TPA: TraB/GumN family protein [Allosphingosinicella sp.]
MVQFGKWMKRAMLLGAALAGLAQPAAAASEPAAPVRPGAAAPTRPPRPAIWVIEDEDTKIYLFGTVHIFAASLDWRSTALNRVIQEADELVMETSDVATAEMGGENELAMMQLGKSVPILERVSPAARPRLEEVLRATGLPMEVFDQLQIWAVAFVLTQFQIMQALREEEGGTELTGAEEVLGQLFRRSKRPISGVETSEEQLGIFARMPLDGQRRFLEATIMGGDPADPAPGSTDANWAAGDVAAIAAEMETLPADLYDALLTRRNRNWTGWLAQRMERPGTVLFAVGAGHLAGRDSVQSMLAARGIQARRID